jgi:hypothetical protein
MNGESAAMSKATKKGQRDVPSPPPPGAIYVTAAQAAGALGVTVRHFRSLRRVPAFPAGRLIGGGGTLRWRLADLLQWADRQPEARFTTVGGRRPGAFGRAA